VADRIRRCENLTYLVNNAGFGTLPLFHESDYSSQDAMARLHVLAMTELTHAALPGMVARGKGNIINVSSCAGFFVSPSNVMYCSTKGWQRMFTEGLAVELESTGVRVQALCPGFTYSEFHDRMGVDRATVPEKWWLKAEDVVDESLTALDRNKTVVIPSRRYKLAMFMMRLMPKWLRRAMARKRHRRMEKAGLTEQM
jgi:short-subunit dehydrogenase